MESAPKEIDEGAILRRDLRRAGCNDPHIEALLGLVVRLRETRSRERRDDTVTAAEMRKELRRYQEALRKVSEIAERLRDGRDPLARAIRERAQQPGMTPLEMLDVPSDAPPLTELAPTASLVLASDAVARMLRAIPDRLPPAYRADHVVRVVALTLYRSSSRYEGEDFLDFELLRSESPKNVQRDPSWINTDPNSAFMAVIKVVFDALGETANPRHAVDVFRGKAEKWRKVQRDLEAAEEALVQAGVTLPISPPEAGDKR